MPLVLAEVAGAVWFYAGSGPAQGQVAVGEPPAAVIIENVPQAARSGLVNDGGLAIGSGGSGPRAVSVGHPGGGDPGLVVGAAADGKAGGCDGQHGVQFPAPGGVDDGVRAGGDLLAVVLQRVVGDGPVQGQVGAVGRLREHLVTHWELRVVQGRNHGEWIFDGIHASYAVVLLSAIRSGTPGVSLAVAGSVDEIAAINTAWIELSTAEVASLTETYVLPWFRTRADREVFEMMRSAASLSAASGWITGHHDARWDFRGSGPDNPLASRTPTDAAWSVLMTAHVQQFGLDQSQKYKQFLRDLPAVVAKNRGVVFGDTGSAVLGSSHPVIIVRHPSRSDDSRTLIASALPESGILHNKGYVHAVSLEEETDSEHLLALLGYLNTAVADWWARRFVDRHVTAPVVNRLALPDWDSGQIRQAASAASALLARRGYTAQSCEFLLEEG